MSKSLSDLIDAIPERERLTSDIDMSEVFKESKGTVFFHYEDPEVADFYRVGNAMAALEADYPDWPQRMAILVMTIAQAHKYTLYNKEKVSEGKTSRIALYAAIIKKNPVAWTRLEEEFNKAFPHVFKIKEAAEEKKSGS